MRLLSIDWFYEIQVLRLIFNFWATFGRKIDVATTHTPYGLGLSSPAKNWPARCPFLVNHYLEIMFPKFSGVTPPFNAISGTL